MAYNDRTIEIYQEALAKRYEAENKRDKALNSFKNVESKKSGLNGNVINKTIGTITDLGAMLQDGVLKAGEGLLDTITQGLGWIGGLFGADTKWASDFINRDLVKEYHNSAFGKWYDNMQGGIGIASAIQGNGFMNGYDDYRELSWKNELPDVVAEGVDGVVSSIGHMLPSIALGSFAGGFGASEKLVKALSMGSFGATAMGNSTEEALNQGADFNTAGTYGALQGGKEMFTEWLGGKLFDSKVFGVLGGSKAGKAGAKAVLKEFGKEMFSEGAEEAIGDLFEPIIKKITINKEEDLGSLYLDSIKSMPMDFITGAITGGIMSGGSVVSNVKTYGIEGFNVQETINEAHEIVQEMVKLEKNNKLTPAKMTEFKENLSKLNEQYQSQVETVRKKYGEDALKTKNIESHQKAMDYMTNSSAQDLAIQDSIAKYNKKNKVSMDYQSLNQADFTEAIETILGENTTNSDRNANAFINDGKIYVNKDSEAYKSGKLYNKVGHEFIHSIENTQDYNNLYNDYVKGLSENQINDIIQQYSKEYNTTDSDYLLKESFADYVGENITVNYNEFSKMLGTNSKLSRIKEKLFGYRGVLNSDSINLQGRLKNALKGDSQLATEGIKMSKVNKKKGVSLTRYEHSTINRSLKDYLTKNNETLVNDKIVRVDDKLMVVDTFSLNEDGTTDYLVSEKIDFEILADGFNKNDIEEIANIVEEAYNESIRHGKKKGLVQIARSVVRESELFKQDTAKSTISKEGNSDESNRSTGEQSESNGGGVSGNNRGIKFSKRTEGEIRNEYTDDFRRIQEESLRLSNDDIQSFHNGSRRIDDSTRGILARAFQGQLRSSSDSVRYEHRNVINNKTGKEFKIYKNVEGTLFHDIFDIVQKYLPNGDCVDVHDIKSSEWSTGYDYCKCYITEDGLGGFAITPSGDLISVFNLTKGGGFLKSIREYVREQGAKTLDCYQSKSQPLATMYENNLGFKTASILEFNYDILVEDRGKAYADCFVETYGESPVHFMVNTTAEVQTKNFAKDQYTEAVEYQHKQLREYPLDKVKFSKNVDSKKQAPKETDSAVAQKAFANLTQGKVYNKSDVSKVLDHIVENIQNKLGTDVKVSLKNKGKVIDSIFNKLNTQVNNSVEDIATAINESMSNITIDGKTPEGIFETFGESYNDFVNENVKSFNNLLQSGKKGKVKALLDYYTNKVSNLSNRLKNAINYDQELRKTVTELRRLIDSKEGKIGSTSIKEGKGITELNPIIKKLDETLTKRTDYLKGDIRGTIKELKEVITSNAYLQADGVVAPELISEMDYIINNIESAVDGRGRQLKLNISEMQSLRRIVRGINKIYQEYDQVILNSKLVKLSEKHDKALKQLKVDKNYEKHTKLKAAFKKLQGYLGLDKARTKFAWLQNCLYDGSFLYEVEHQLREGSNLKLKVKQNMLTDKLIKLSQKNIDKLSKSNLTIQGHKITDGQAMSIYFLSKRAQANSHIQGEGIRLNLGDNKSTKAFKLTQSDIESIRKHIESNYAELAKEFEILYYEKAQKWYNDTLEARTGYRAELEENYFPMHTYNREFTSNVGDVNSLMSGYQEFLNPSFTKNTVEGAENSLVVDDIRITTATFVEQMSNYAGISPTIQSINRLFNTPIEVDGKTTTLMNHIEETSDSTFKNYLNTLLINMQGRLTTNQKGGSKFLGKIRGNLASYSLGANAKVFLSQVCSLPQAISELGFMNTLKGAFSGKANFKLLMEKSSYFKNRFENNGAMMSQLVMNDPNLLTTGASKVGRAIKKGADLTTKPIGFFDKITIGRIYNGAIAKVAKDNGVSVNTVKNTDTLMNEAITLTEEITRRTQPQYDVLENGSTVYGAGEIMKSFYMYGSVTRNYANDIALKLHDFMVDPKDQKAVFGRILVGFLTSQLLVSMLGSGFKDLLGKLDRDDDDDKIDDYLKDTLIATAENTTINMIPFMKDAYNKLIRGYDLDNVSLEYFNSMLESAEHLQNVSSADNATRGRAWYNLAKNFGMTFGIPVKNITEYSMGILSKFKNETAIKSQNVLYFVDSSEAKNNMAKAYLQGRPSVIKANLGTILDKGQLSTPNTQTSTEIARLYSLGYTQVIPSTSIDTFTVDGQTYSITGSTLKKFAKTYNEATLEVEDLISSKGYSKLSDEQKSKAIKRLYNLYYGVAKSEVVSTYELSPSEEALYHMNGSELVIILANIENIKATKIKTRKEQIKNYLNTCRLSIKAKNSIYEILGYDVK